MFPPDTPTLDLSEFDPEGRRRVRVICPTFYPEPIGTPLYATEYVRWLHKSGWEVDVVTCQPFYPRFERYPGYGRQRRQDHLDFEVPVHRLPTLVPRNGGSAWRAVTDSNFLLQGCLASLRKLSRVPLTLAISPGVPFTVLGARALTTRKGVVVSWVQDIQTGLASALSAPTARLTRLISATERACLARADHTFTLSDEMGAQLTRMGLAGPIRTAGLWSTLRPDDGPAPQPIADVQYSGNIGRKQGADQLLDLAAELQRRRPGTTLLIRADAQARRILEDSARELNLTNLTFADLAPAEGLRRALREARVYVVPQAPGVGDSVLPSKIINALAAPTLVVAAASPDSAVAQMSQKYPNLFIVPPGNVNAMASAVLALIG